MSQSIERALSRTTTSIFEDVSFLVADRELSEVQETAAAAAEAWLGFQGPVVGGLRVRVHGELLPQIAANLLGLAAPPAAATQLDALGELANMICGGVLPVLAPGADFRLDPPHLRLAAAAGAAREDAPVAATRLGLEDGRVEVQLFARPAPQGRTA